ncbi:MAG: recombination protein NinG [bacterium]|nr:recombination protein NinG [bacterium]
MKIPETYKNKSLSELKNLATKWTNKVVRKRDEGKKCISCGQYKTLEAGHFYSAGHHDHIRYLLDNIHGQCTRCNRHLHGNLIEYRRGLVVRFGEDFVASLDLKKQNSKGWNGWDRFSLIILIQEMQQKFKELNKSFQL